MSPPQDRYFFRLLRAPGRGSSHENRAADAMPTYDYECPKGHRFEIFQKMTDEPVAACPECGADARRQISGGAGFLFKGEGFYITDYRSADYKKKASAEKGESAGGSSAASDSSAAPSRTDTSSSGSDSSSSGSSSGSGSSGSGPATSSE